MWSWTLLLGFKLHLRECNTKPLPGNVTTHHNIQVGSPTGANSQFRWVPVDDTLDTSTALEASGVLATIIL
ncbi:hypothetical protein ACFX2F_043620 [Malus domestica]